MANTKDVVSALKIGETVHIPGHGSVMGGYVRRLKRYDYCLADNANKYRSRFGNLKQILEDLAFYEQNGHLPPASGEPW